MLSLLQHMEKVQIQYSSCYVSPSFGPYCNIVMFVYRELFRRHRLNYLFYVLYRARNRLRILFCSPPCQLFLSVLYPLSNSSRNYLIRYKKNISLFIDICRNSMIYEVAIATWVMSSIWSQNVDLLISTIPYFLISQCAFRACAEFIYYIR